MRPPRSRHARERGPDRRKSFESLRDDLEGDVKAPDQTAAIMRRLGYVRVDADETRRRRGRRTRGQVVLSLTAGLVLAAGAAVYCKSDRVRRPVGTTVPQALQHDLEQHRERFDRTFRTIRNLAPPPVDRAPRTEELDTLAVGPVRWL